MSDPVDGLTQRDLEGLTAEEAAELLEMVKDEPVYSSHSASTDDVDADEF